MEEDFLWWFLEKGLYASIFCQKTRIRKFLSPTSPSIESYYIHFFKECSCLFLSYTFCHTADPSVLCAVQCAIMQRLATVALQSYIIRPSVEEPLVVACPSVCPSGTSVISQPFIHIFSLSAYQKLFTTSRQVP